MSISTKQKNYFCLGGVTGGRYENGWGILEEATKGLAALVLIRTDVDIENSVMLQFETALRRDNAPANVLRARAATELRRYWPERFSFRKIESVLSQSDASRCRALLVRFAEILSPTQ